MEYDIRRASNDPKLRQEAPAKKQQIQAKAKRLEFVQSRLERLKISTAQPGRWICPQADVLKDTFVPHGKRIGIVADLRRLRIRAAAGQDIAMVLKEQARPTVDIRVAGRGELKLTGTLEKILPAGQEELPSEALGFQAGGKTPTDPKDPRKASSPIFEVWVLVDPGQDAQLLVGQRVLVRFHLDDKTLGRKWWTSIRRLLLRRFKT
jgi:hypothetical protein